MVALSIGPPMIRGQRPKAPGSLEEGAAAGGQSPIRPLERGKGASSHPFVEQGPEPLGRLHFGGTRRSGDEGQASGPRQLGRARPGGAVHTTHHGLAGADPFGTHDFVEGQLHSPRIDVR